MKALRFIVPVLAALIFSGEKADALSVSPNLTILGAECATDVSNSIPGLGAISLNCGTTASRQLAGNINSGSGFYSLGLASDSTFTTGGVIAFEITKPFAGIVNVTEVTNPSNHHEAADVFVSNTLNWGDRIYMGTFDNGRAYKEPATSVVDIDAGPWKYLFIADSTRRVYGTDTASTDGFDIASLELISAVPLPAGAVLLLSGLGALALRRRKG
ncbi:VPLPA-CTERM sorting domain-containing protein [Pseudooceanicola sp.]|uniref:VPLPA-CTERM sorting domain-containing protein n=1 Tax=Pseudooceanicola sp. TaxID=1914328 RepID=UPI0035C6A6EA